MYFKSGFFLIVCFFLSCNSGFEQDHLSIFRYNQNAEISSLDPAFAKDQASIWACNHLFNGLVQLDENLKIIPAIAKKWTISEDGMQYTFILRDDVFFHSHKIFHKKRKVVAQDFVYSFNRLTDKQLASPGAWVLSSVQNYIALNDTILEIKLKNPFPPFLGILSMPYCSVVPKEIVETTDFRSHPVGTGPFHFQHWKEGVKLVLRRNPNYFESDGSNRLPYLDAVSISFLQDKQAAFLEFIKGNLDFISGIDASYKDELLERDGSLRQKYNEKLKLQSQSYLNTEYLGFLMENDSLPIAVRRAINYGFDRKKMLRFLRNNIGTPALQGFIPKGLPSFVDQQIGYEYNPIKAKELILASGFDTQNEIVLSTTASYVDLCEYFQSAMSEIGLKIRIEVNPPSTHRQMVATGKLSFFRGSWIADYADAENYLSLFYSKNFSPNGPNYTHFYHAEFDRLYQDAMNQSDENIRNKIYQKMDKIIVDNAVVVPLYYDQVLNFLQPNISGFSTNPLNLLDLKRVKKN